MRARRTAAILAFLAGTTVLGACHRYVPLENPSPGDVVRVRVPVRSAIDDPNAAENTAAIEGSILSAARDTIVLAMETRRDLGAFRGEMVQYDTLRLARSGLTSVELQEFSSGRSILLGVALAGAATGFALTALGVEGGEAGGETPGDGTNPEGALVPSRSVNFAPLVRALFGLIGG